MWSDVICTVGAELNGGTRELLGPGRMAYITPQTNLAPDILLHNGEKIIVDAHESMFRGEVELVVSHARRFAVAAVDIERFEAFNAALRRAGLADRVVDDVAAHLERRFEENLRQGNSWLPDPTDENVSVVFPTTFWHAGEVEHGVQDMRELLHAEGIAGDIDEAAIRRAYEAREGTPDDDDDDDIVRRHDCGELARAANVLLARANDARRFVPVRSLNPRVDPGEPTWLLLPPAAVRSLIDDGIYDEPEPLEQRYAP